MDPSKLISHRFQFEIVDGRTIEGMVIAIDDESNILATDAHETNGDIQRSIGLVSIPRKTISKVLSTEDDWSRVVN